MLRKLTHAIMKKVVGMIYSKKWNRFNSKEICTLHIAKNDAVDANFRGCCQTTNLSIQLNVYLHYLIILIIRKLCNHEFQIPQNSRILLNHENGTHKNK